MIFLQLRICEWDGSIDTQCNNRERIGGQKAGTAGSTNVRYAFSPENRVLREFEGPDVAQNPVLLFDRARDFEGRRCPAPLCELTLCKGQRPSTRPPPRVPRTGWSGVSSSLHEHQLVSAVVRPPDSPHSAFARGRRSLPATIMANALVHKSCISYRPSLALAPMHLRASEEGRGTLARITLCGNLISRKETTARAYLLRSADLMEN